MRTAFLRCAAFVALLARTSHADVECRASSRAEPAFEARIDAAGGPHVEAQRLDAEVTRQEQDVAAKEQTASDAHARLRLAEGGDPSRANRAAELDDASRAVIAADAAWQTAKARLECTKRDRDAAWVHYWRQLVGGTTFGAAAALGGAAGGANRYGGVFTVSHNDNVTRDFEIGVGVLRIREIGTEERERSWLAGAMLRYYFSHLRVGVFLAMGFDFTFRHLHGERSMDNGAVLALNPQFGVRIRSASSDPSGVMRLFLEPRVVTDGQTPVSVFFGLELGGAVRRPLPKDDPRRVDAKSAHYTYHP